MTSPSTFSAQTWLANVNNPGAPDSTAAYVDTIRSLHAEMTEDGKNGFSSINGKLGLIDFNLINPYHVVILLRTLFSIRHQLPEWHAIENACRQELTLRFRQQVDVGSLMRGLDVDAKYLTRSEGKA